MIFLLVAAAFAVIAVAIYLGRIREEVTAPSAPPEPEKPFDWFDWESRQIQNGGYVFWFDHWRYDGEPGAYLDPTPEQRRRVFEASLAKARRKFGAERLDDLIAAAVERLKETGLSEHAAYERVRSMGQDPVQFAIDIAEGRRSPDLLQIESDF